jgi:hypothetical protein
MTKSVMLLASRPILLCQPFYAVERFIQLKMRVGDKVNQAIGGKLNSPEFINQVDLV